MRRCLRSLAAFVLMASPLLAQDSLPPVTTTRAATTEWLRNLPIDFLEGFFVLEPGIGPITGGYSLRGGAPNSFATYVDGTPVDAGYRGGSETTRNPSGAALELPAVGVHAAAMTTGVLGLNYTDGQSGVLALGTTKGSGRITAGLDYASEGINSASSSVGLNRLEAGIAGGVGRRFGFSFAGIVTGQPSVAYGPGQANVPVYEAIGVDTTVAVPSVIGDPLADTTYVPVSSFEANNGTFVPFSAESNYQLVGRMDYAVSSSTSLILTGIASQNQFRQFDYLNLYNPAQATAARAASHAYTLSLAHTFPNAKGMSRELDLAFSAQGDQFESGPLSPQGEAASRDPAGGFMVSPLDFQFGLNDFPVNDELVTNVRLNTAGSRRSPYDLENTAQYSLVDRYRNNAYGALGFSEAGGPVGLLSLTEENRLVGRAALGWGLDTHQTLHVGGEYVSYDLSNYSHQLTSQAYSDVYVEQPARQGAFLEDRITLGSLIIAAGLRYDRFRTGAGRVDGVPRISSNPDFDPNNPGSVDALFTPDEAHTAWSPRLQAGYRVSPTTDVRAGVGRQVQMPDFGLSLAGINTDISVTTPYQVYGSDLGYASTVLLELGATHRFSTATSLDVAVYGKNLSGQVVVEPVTEYDPLRLQDVTVYRYLDTGEGHVTGAELRLDQQLGPYFKAFLGYAYVHATTTGGTTASWSRPSTFAGAFGGTLPGGWKSGSLLGAILQNGGAWGTFRVASGTPYTACALNTGNEAVLSGQPCLAGIAGDLNGARLPTTSQVDLKLARGFELGGTTITAYLDVRNLFNADNATAVYAVTGTRESPAFAGQTWRSDSAGYASEAQANGVELGDGSINLQFGGAGAGGCGNWTTQDGRPNAPNCVYLVRAEQRFGNGDGVFDQAEQRRASTALYQVLHGGQLYTGPGRVLRLGVRVAL